MVSFVCKRVQSPAIKTTLAFTLIELVVVVAIIGLLVAILVPAIQSIRESARRSSCQNNAQQIGLALMSYESAHEVFPPGQLGPTAKTASLSFERHQLIGHLAYALNFLEQRTFIKSLGEMDWDLNSESRPWYRASGAWEASNRRIPVLNCPSDSGERPEIFQLGRSGINGGIVEHLVVFAEGDLPYSNGWTNYLGCSGDVSDGLNQGIFFSRSTIGYKHIGDGSSNTILLGEAFGGSGFVDKGEFFKVIRRNSLMGNGIGANFGFFDDIPDDGQDTTAFVYSSQHSGRTVNFVMADGSTSTIKYGIQADVLESLMTRNKNEQAN